MRRYRNRAVIQANSSVFFQEFLDDTLDLGVFALPNVLKSDSSFPIDKVLRRPGSVVERLPNAVVAVDGNWVSNVQIAHRVFHIRTFFLERELRGVHTDHNQARILIFCSPALHVGQRPQGVDAGVSPEID